MDAKHMVILKNIVPFLGTGVNYLNATCFQSECTWDLRCLCLVINVRQQWFENREKSKLSSAAVSGCQESTQERSVPYCASLSGSFQSGRILTELTSRGAAADFCELAVTEPLVM